MYSALRPSFRVFCAVNRCSRVAESSPSLTFTCLTAVASGIPTFHTPPASSQSALLVSSDATPSIVQYPIFVVSTVVTRASTSSIRPVTSPSGEYTHSVPDHKYSLFPSLVSYQTSPVSSTTSSSVSGSTPRLVGSSACRNTLDWMSAYARKKVPLWAMAFSVSVFVK